MTLRTPVNYLSRVFTLGAPANSTILVSKKIKTYPPPPSHRAKHPFAVADWQAYHQKQLDPTGSRTRLFDRNNPDVPRVGDILLVAFKTGDPFAGVCLSIKMRGVDTGILLRNKLHMVGVEMWVKIYSPNVMAIEVVKRAEKRARRGKLYYMRYVALFLPGVSLLWGCSVGIRG